MVDKIATVHSGVVGRFWPALNGLASWRGEPERGHAMLGDDRLIHLKALDEQPSKKRRVRPFPVAITGVTEAGGIMLLDIVGVGRTTYLAGLRASAVRYRARTLVTDVLIPKLASEKLRSVSAHFYGISDWFGLSSLTEEWANHEGTDRLKSFGLTADVKPEQVADISRGRQIQFTPHWQVGGTADRRIVSAPVSVACRTDKPRNLNLLRWPLMRIQDLVSVAYEGLISAENGRATLDTADSEVISHFWDSYLMTMPPGVHAPADLELPFFNCADIGGIHGVVRWIRLCDTHMRAVSPLVERYRQGIASAPLRLMEAAAGIEYWVASHRRGTKWASKRCPQRGHSCGHAWTLATHVGTPFAEWIGDVDLWAGTFWKTYNDLKHNPAHQVDEYKLGALAESGRLLLASALLNRVALSKQPSRLIFQKNSHRTWQLKSRLLEVMT